MGCLPIYMTHYCKYKLEFIVGHSHDSRVQRCSTKSNHGTKISNLDLSRACQSSQLASILRDARRKRGNNFCCAKASIKYQQNIFHVSIPAKRTHTKSIRQTFVFIAMTLRLGFDVVGARLYRRRIIENFSLILIDNLATLTRFGSRA